MRGTAAASLSGTAAAASPHDYSGTLRALSTLPTPPCGPSLLQINLVYRKMFPWCPLEPWTAGHETAVAVGPKGLIVGATICCEFRCWATAVMCCACERT